MSRMLARGVMILVALAAIALPAPVGQQRNAAAAPVATYVVNLNGGFAGPDPTDLGDINIGDGHCDIDAVTPGDQCTLRAAIQEANATIALDEIDFNIPPEAPITTCKYDPMPPALPTVICPTYTLPTISAPVIIDATTQAGYAGSPIIELDGRNGNGVGVGPGVDALLITAGASTIRGLWIHGFTRYGIDLRTYGANTVEANWIGDVDLVNTDSRIQNTNDGVFIDNVPNNTIGGVTPDKRNVLAGNGGIGSPASPGYGVTISGVGATNNVVAGNYIGTDETGTLDKGNTKAGVYVNGAPNNTIGGTASGAGNVISANDGGGIEIAGGGASGNLVQGNLIGTTPDGLAARANSGNGVYINGAPNNTVGGIVAGARNLISKNSTGIRIYGSAATGNLVQGNYIGTNINGTGALGNTSEGVYVSGAPGNTIGGASVSDRNVIAGNGSRGVAIDGNAATGNLVQGNFIGTDVTGLVPLGNKNDGVYVSGAHDNTIGGTSPGAGNLISGNGIPPTTGSGIQISGSQAKNNLVQGNFIGTNLTGAVTGGDLGNWCDGVRINSAPQNTIGGLTAAARNVIAGNGRDRIVGNTVWTCSNRNGVEISGGTSSANLVQGNYIGTDLTGTVALGNAGEGVYLNAAPNNVVGGTDSGAGNVISANGRGVTMFSSTATGNVVQGNMIGANASGTARIGNISDGVFISSAPGNTIGGDSGPARNVISGNGAVGVELYDIGSKANLVDGNFIGTDVTGAITDPDTIPGSGDELGNSSDGVFINNAPTNTIGAPGAGNVISGNYIGVNISGAGATGNLVQSNRIGTNLAGTSGLGNIFDGVRAGAYSATSTIGGTAAGTPNIIAFNGGDGVLVDRSTGNRIQGNAVFDNEGTAPSSSGLGIDLVSALEGLGPTLNDIGDADTGGNNYQNFPLVTYANSTVGSTTIQGTFNSTPGTGNFRLEFFSSPACDPSGYGEAKNYLGFTTVNTDGGGDATFNVTFPVTTVNNWAVTATATDPTGNTSEFSACFAATGPSDVDGDGVVDSADNCPATYNPDQANHDGELIPTGRGLSADTTNPIGDGLGDACDLDDDNDGLPDTAEVVFPVPGCPPATGPTDPLKPDTDGDGVIDGVECALGSDPTNAASKPAADASCADPDADGIRSALEVRGWGTSPALADSDGDGKSDGVEIMDIDGNGVVNLSDAVIVLKAGSNVAPYSPPPLTAEEKHAYDIDRNGVVNLFDAVLVMRWAGGMPAC